MGKGSHRSPLLLLTFSYTCCQLSFLCPQAPDLGPGPPVTNHAEEETGHKVWLLRVEMNRTTAMRMFSSGKGQALHLSFQMYLFSSYIYTSYSRVDLPVTQQDVNADLDPKDVPLPPSRSSSLSLPMPSTQLPQNNPLPPSPTGTSAPMPPIGEPSPDQGIGQGKTKDQPEMVRQLRILPVLESHLSLSRGVPRAQMTRFSVFESRLSVQVGPNYMILSTTSIRAGLWIIRRISTLSWCL